MPKFGDTSYRRLNTCHELLIELMEAAIQGPMDFTVTCGHRGEEAQNEAFHDGRSTKRWPMSKHNVKPSLAVDIAPWSMGSIPWHDEAAFARLAGVIEATAHRLGIGIRWGGDWNGNERTEDERFIDMPHFELVMPQPKSEEV